MRFDESSRVFEISVRELAEDEGFRRVGFDRGDGWRRLGLGAQIHARVLAERLQRAPGLSLRGPSPGSRAGRGLDGGPLGPPRRLRRARARPLADRGAQVDEPVGRRSARPPATRFERDRRQLLGYCYLWRRLGHARVDGALVYVDIETGEEISLDVPFGEDDRAARSSAGLARSLAIWRARPGRAPPEGRGRRERCPSRMPPRGPSRKS